MFIMYEQLCTDTLVWNFHWKMLKLLCWQRGGTRMAIEYRGEKFAGYNKPKRTPSHPTKSHAVLAKEGETVKLIRFGEQGASTAGKPKAGESDKMKKKRASFKARHAKNIKRGKLSAAYWADKVKW